MEDEFLKRFEKAQDLVYELKESDEETVFTITEVSKAIDIVFKTGIPLTSSEDVRERILGELIKQTLL